MAAGRHIDIEYADIEGDLNASGLTVKELSAIGTTFQGNADFRSAIFQGDANFGSIGLQTWPHSLSATFQGFANFRWVTFQGVANFGWVTFQGGADFLDATFEGNAHFSSATFQGGARFRSASFRGDAYFRRATFQGGEFMYATFLSAAAFSEAAFQGDVSFGYATFQGATGFEYAIFQGYIDFRQVRYRQDFILTGASFADAVGFQNVSATGMEVTWDQLEGRLSYNDRFYATLVANFNSRGQFDDADNAFYAYRVAKRDHDYPSPNLRNTLELVFLDWTCGYGVKPTNALFCSAAVILFGALLFYQKNAIRPAKSNPEHESRGRWKRLRDAIYFSVIAFTTVGFGDWLPTEEPILKFNGKRLATITIRGVPRELRIPALHVPVSYRMVAALEGIFGWLLLALFLVTLGKVWIR